MYQTLWFTAFAHTVLQPYDKNVILDGIALERVKHTKFLCVLIGDFLTRKNHIECISP